MKEFPLLTTEDAVAIKLAMDGGGPYTEFQYEQMLEWASNVKCETVILRSILAGQVKVSKVRHQILESCDFTVGV